MPSAATQSGSAALAAVPHVVINHECVSHAKALIAAGKIGHGAWDESKVDRASSNGSSFLGKDTSMKPEDSGYWKFPIISDGKVNRKALGSAQSYAEQNGDSEIASAAKSLSEESDRKRAPAELPAATADKPTEPIAALRSLTALRAPIVYSNPGDVEVDEQTGVIKNVSLMTVGPARGHGFDIDETTNKQLAELINSDPSGIGVKCRVTHPRIDDDGAVADDLMQLVGRVRNARIVGNAVRGDVFLGDYAKKVPGLGDVWSYLCSLAKNDPTALGMSAMFSFDIDPQIDGEGNPTSLPARVGSVVGVDFVGKPAANPNGLLSQPANSSPPPAAPLTAKPQVQITKGLSNMDAELKALLVGMGLKANATDDEAQEYMNGLGADQKATLGSKYNTTTNSGKGACADAVIDPKVAALADPARAAVDRDDQIVALESKRKTQIVALAAALKVGDVAIDQATVLECVSGGLTVDQARPVMLRALAKKTISNLRDPNADPNVTLGDSRIDVSDDNGLATLREQASDALALKMIDKCYDRFNEPAKHKKMTDAIKNRDNHRVKQMASLRYNQFCRMYLAALGMKNTENLSDAKLAESTTVRGLRSNYGRIAALAESIGDLGNITLDAFNKTLRLAYLDAPRSWPTWARRATAPDFKNINRIVLSEAPSMVNRNQGGELKYVTLTDSKETYSLSTYSQLIRMTWRLVINDDMNSLARVPLLQANAAMRQEEDTAYAIITVNAALADTGALFNSTAVTTAGGHANLAGGGTALSVSSLQTGWAAIKKQKGLAGSARLELVPKFLLVPTSIEFSTQQLIGSDYLIPGIAGGGSSGTPVAGTVNQGQRNPFVNKLTVIGSTRLDDNSNTAWYLFSDYRDGQTDTIEVCFLEDEPEPVAKSETDFDTDDIKFALRHTVAAKAIDYRGLYKNPGA